MDWLQTVFTSTDSVAHIVLLYAIVISVGIGLGRIKIGGISLGVTFVLFAGILAGHIGFTGTPNVLNFIQDFGLILFVYCIGLQVGPGFFESMKEGGVKLNLMALTIILLNVICCIGLYYLVFFDGSLSPRENSTNLAMMVGVLCGAVTNTPGLGAATEACSQIFGSDAPAIANGYACAYPLGVIGIIMATIAIRYICHVSLQQEENQIEKERAENPHVKPHKMTLEAMNKSLSGRTLMQVKQFLARDFVVSRILQDGHVSIPNRDTIIHEGDKMFVVCAEDDAEAIKAFIGPEAEVEWADQDMPFVSKHVLNLYADRNLRMQVGDKIVVVGPEDAVDRVASKMGNSVKSLDHPNLAAIFIGIFIGIIFGSIPFAIPGVPTPVKLGLAGGPLIVAILIGRFGYKMKLVSYTTTSANLMLREIGLSLFLASVGIKAGATFVDTVVAGDGLTYVWCGFIITVLPILIVGTVARLHYKLNYFTLMGLISGSTTDPPALAFANQTASNDAPAVGYSTVYPLSMFLRILTAQLIILFLCVV